MQINHVKDLEALPLDCTICVLLGPKYPKAFSASYKTLHSRTVLTYEKFTMKINNFLSRTQKTHKSIPRSTYFDCPFSFSWVCPEGKRECI